MPSDRASIPINPRILRWARETTRLDIATAARLAGIKNPEKFSMAEAGTASLTFRQLEQFSKACRLPVNVFYLPQPPNQEPIPVDYRAEGSEKLDYKGMRTLREAVSRRDAVVDLIEDLEIEIPPLPIGASDQVAAKIIHELVGAESLRAFSEAQGQSGRSLDGSKALSLTKEIVESRLPVLVFETTLDTRFFRGCSLYNERLSVILLSSKDSPNARRFTLAHELAHLLMRESGLCDPAGAEIRQSPTIEARCNLIAGEALLPSATLEAFIAEQGDRSVDSLIQGLVRSHLVSHSAAAVRLHQAGRLSSAQLREKLDLYYQTWLANRAKQSESDGGPSFHMLQVQRLGPTFTNLVLNGVANDSLSVTRAANLLGVSASYKSFTSMRDNLVSVYGH